LAGLKRIEHLRKRLSRAQQGSDGATDGGVAS